MKFAKLLIQLSVIFFVLEAKVSEDLTQVFNNVDITVQGTDLMHLSGAFKDLPGLRVSLKGKSKAAENSKVLQLNFIPIKTGPALKIKGLSQVGSDQSNLVYFKSAPIQSFDKEVQSFFRFFESLPNKKIEMKAEYEYERKFFGLWIKKQQIQVIFERVGESLLFTVRSKDSAVSEAIEAKKRHLFDAIEESDLSKVKLILKAGADIEERGFGEMTPLLKAAITRQWNICLFLIEQGADPTVTDFRGMSMPYLLYKFPVEVSSFQGTYWLKMKEYVQRNNLDYLNKEPDEILKLKKTNQLPIKSN